MKDVIRFLWAIAIACVYLLTLQVVDAQELDTIQTKDNLNPKLPSFRKDSIAITDGSEINLDTLVKHEVGENFDTLPKSKKQVKIDKNIDPESYHAKRAAIWGTLPGGGQIYNKKWWKVPIAWAMIGAGGYFIYKSGSDMRTYNKALDMRNSGQVDEFANILTESQLISYRNQYRRNLQLSVFGTAGLWGLIILDAVVDAHLKTYDISDNLSIKFKPKVLRVYNNSVPSVSITLYL